MRFHIVLEDQAAKGSGRLVFCHQFGQDKHQVVVEVWEFVELFQFLHGR